MDTVVQHAGAWTVESVQLDLDDTGPRQWNRVVRPGERERWCTTSELRVLLRAAGLDIADLVLGPLDRQDSAGPTGQDPHEPDPGHGSEPDEDLPDDTDDECE
jgi:hypothetical protein